MAAQSAASFISARSGSGVELCVGRDVAGALVDRALERRRRLGLEGSVGDVRLEALGALGPEDVDPAVEDTAAARDCFLAFLDACEQG